MEKALSIKEVAITLGVHTSTLYSDPERYGFFKVGKKWKVFPSDLEKKLKPKDNLPRFALSVGGMENNLCRSMQEKTYGGLMSQPRVEKELDDLLVPQTRKTPKNIMTN